jgi:rRNA-processing protein FCF1
VIHQTVTHTLNIGIVGVHSKNKIFLYRCVIAELKKLGKDFSETLALARKLDAAKCVSLICSLFVDMIQHCA